jgi:hypothetical protein
MIFGDILTEVLCKLHEHREARNWRRGRAERRKRALRKKGWDELYDHMSRHSVRTAPGATAQQASLTAREAVAADRAEPNVR